MFKCFLKNIPGLNIWLDISICVYNTIVLDDLFNYLVDVVCVYTVRSACHQDVVIQV